MSEVHAPLFFFFLHGMCLFSPSWLPCLKICDHGSSLYRPNPCAIQSILGKTLLLLLKNTYFWCWLYRLLTLTRSKCPKCLTVCAWLQKQLLDRYFHKGLQPLKPIGFSYLRYTATYCTSLQFCHYHSVVSYKAGFLFKQYKMGCMYIDRLKSACAKVKYLILYYLIVNIRLSFIHVNHVIYKYSYDLSKI